MFSILPQDKLPEKTIAEIMEKLFSFVLILILTSTVQGKCEKDQTYQDTTFDQRTISTTYKTKTPDLEHCLEFCCEDRASELIIFFKKSSELFIILQDVLHSYSN